MNILILEPNRLLAAQYKTFLEAEKHTVVWRQNAQTGIGAADSIKPDLVIVELLLAGHSGVEFLYEFRSYGDWQNVPVILMSNLEQAASGVSAAALKDLGVGAYFYKPKTTLEQLGKTVNLLGQKPKKVSKPR